MTSGEKILFGVGGGLILVGIAYAYITAKKTVKAGAEALTTAGGLIPTPAELARTGGVAAGYFVDAAGNVVQSGTTAIGTAWDMWKTGVNYAGIGAGIGTIFPGDLPPAGSSLPPRTEYTGYIPEEHALDEYVRTGTMPHAMTSLYDIVIWTVGRHFRGEAWDSADWSNMMSYFQSGYAVQDPYLYERAVMATEQQQNAMAPAVGGQDQWTTG